MSYSTVTLTIGSASPKQRHPPLTPDPPTPRTRGRLLCEFLEILGTGKKKNPNKGRKTFPSISNVKTRAQEMVYGEQRDGFG